MSKTEETIREMAKLSLITNKINNIQEMNLKMYALAFFNNVVSARIDYDFSNNAMVDTEKDEKNLSLSYKFNKVDTSHFRISYHLNLDSSKEENTNLDKRFGALEHAVRTLFWKDIKVQVFFNDIKVFESNNV